MCGLKICANRIKPAGALVSDILAFFAVVLRDAIRVKVPILVNEGEQVQAVIASVRFDGDSLRADFDDLARVDEIERIVFRAVADLENLVEVLRAFDVIRHRAENADGVTRKNVGVIDAL